MTTAFSQVHFEAIRYRGRYIFRDIMNFMPDKTLQHIFIHALLLPHVYKCHSGLMWSMLRIAR